MAVLTLAATVRRGTGRLPVGWRPFLAPFLLAPSLLGAANAQVQNLRFDDTDTGTGTIGGIVYWEQPNTVDPAVVSYRVFIAQDSAGSGQKQVSDEVLAGAWTSWASIAANTASTGYTHLLVYLVDGSGTKSPASICLQDNPGAVDRTMYVTTTGYTKAATLKASLVQACHANEHRIGIEMVATAMWDGSAVQETLFDDASETSESAVFSVTFPTGASLATIDALLDSPPLPAVAAVAGSGSYRLGLVQAASTMGPFVEVRPDPDVGRYIARACVKFAVAAAAWVNRVGEVRILTKTDKESAVTAVVQVFQSWSTPSYEHIDGTSASLLAIDQGATASSAACLQISLDATHPECAR